MTRLNVNPTRMELKKLRARLSTAVRGHKLLKDKSDEMIRRFSIILREDYALRREVEAALSDGLRRFSVARSVTPAYEAETAFALPTVGIAADCGVESVMGVDVPKIVLTERRSSDELPYAYPEITSEADDAVKAIAGLLPRLIRLAETEKAVRLLAAEIERNKRRVNALEYIMIPQLEETIKYIRDKLSENERASLVRLMKGKGKGAEG